MKITTKVENVEKVNANLMQVDKNSEEAIFQALKFASQLLVRDIKLSITAWGDIDTGLFRKGIHAEYPSKTEAIVADNVFYGKFLEYGTSPHFISPKTKKVLAWQGGGKWFFSKGHMVRGITPRRHFGNTLSRDFPEMQRIFEERLNANLGKNLSKT